MSRPPPRRHGAGGAVRWTMTREDKTMTDHDWLELLMVLLTFLAQKLSR